MQLIHPDVFVLRFSLTGDYSPAAVADDVARFLGANGNLLYTLSRMQVPFFS